MTPFGQISLGHTVLQTGPEIQSQIDFYVPVLHTELPFIILTGMSSFRYSKNMCLIIQDSFWKLPAKHILPMSTKGY